MNILIYPMYSVDNINADSNYIIISNLIRGLYKEHNFVLLINKNLAYEKDDLYKYCKIVYINAPTAKRDFVTWFSPKLIRTICNKYSIQLIFNNVVEQGHNLKFIHPTLDPSWYMKVINYHHYNIHPSFGEAIANSMKNVLLNQLTGSLLVDVNYFHTNHSYNMFKDCYNDYYINEIKNVHVELGKHAGVIEKADKYPVYTFIYNHRLAGYKNYAKTIELFDRLYLENPNFKVIFTCADTANASKIEKLPYANVVRCNNHKEYLKILAKCHANVTNSTHETYCISIAESMQAGHLIIAPNGVTFPELLGKDYKYLFTSDEQQYKMMLDAVTNKITNIKHQPLDETLQIDIYRKLLDKVQYSKRPLERSKHKDKFIKLFNKNVIENQDATKICASLNLATQSFPSNKVACLLEDLGYKYELKTNNWHR